MRRVPSLRKDTARGRAFTIVEVLATITLAAIVLPAVVDGILLSLAVAENAAQGAEAASLAQSKLDEIVVAGEYTDAEMTGDFGEDLPEYSWDAFVNEWEDSRLVQVDVVVKWTRRGRQRSVTLSTLVYRGIPDG